MRVKPGVVIQKLGDTFVAYDNETSTLHEFNEVGFLILTLLEKGKVKLQILKEIIEKYKVSADVARQDYDAFVKKLKSKDLIVGKK